MSRAADTGASNEPNVWAAAADDTFAFWLDRGSGAAGGHDGRVVRRRLDQAEPATALAVSQEWPMDLALDDTYVYWATILDQRIWRCAKTGCSAGAETVADLPSVAPFAIGLDELAVYVLDSDGHVLRIAK